MAFTITDGDLAVAIRIVTDPDSVPKPVAVAMQYIRALATEQIAVYAPDAPDGAHDGALVRLAGWYYYYEDDSLGGAVNSPVNPILASGAAAILSQWRVHNAGVIAGDDGPVPGPSPAPPAGPGNVPEPPGDGYFILTSNDGQLTWVAFPPPE